MFIFFPYRTDAPVYHFPWATLGVIAITTLVYVAQANTQRFDYLINFDSDEGFERTEEGEGEEPTRDEDDDQIFWTGDGLARYRRTWIDECALQWGEGIKPHQWVTANFLHGGWFHLIINMLFLWVFGLIVEGKIGSWRFVLLYLTIGTAGNGIEQVIASILGGEAGSIGASGAIFGLMAIALVWAPMNEVDTFCFVIYRAGSLSLTVRTLAGLYFVMELIFAALDLSGPQGVGSAILHLLGFAIGFPIGISFLRRGWVDCEGWDLFSIKDGRGQSKTQPDLEDEVPDYSDEHRNSMIASLREFQAERETHLALQLCGDFVRRFGAAALPADILRTQIRLSLEAGELASIGELLEDAHRRQPDSAAFALLLARYRLENEKKPASAFDLLDDLDDDSALSSKQLKMRDELRRRAREAIDGGELELDLDD